MPKSWVGEQPFRAAFQENSGSEKVLEKKGEYQDFPWKVFLSHSADKFGRGTTLPCCVSENSWQRNYFEKEGDRVSKVSVEMFLSHSAKIFGRRTTLHFCAVFQRNFGSEKVLKKRGKDY